VIGAGLRPLAAAIAIAVAAALAGSAEAGPAAGGDPLSPDQWYLTRTRALEGLPASSGLAPVRVAIIDSGVDRRHPDLAGRIVGARSFVGGTVDDTQGHGTVVAGIVAANVDNGIGIAGLAPTAELLVAKVVAADGTISPRAEARAIRWAVDSGARILNMSLGGLRDPRDADRDEFSVREAEAVRYAVKRGVLVVAAVGNGDQAPREPWPFATYPAALRHVLGVSAVGRTGGVPSFSNRDQVFNDIAAPGVAIVSTFPRSLTEDRPDCEPQGYTLCASDDFVEPDGTSFAAPQVTAIAANLLAVRPSLRAEQLSAILMRTAADATPATGCTRCSVGRDALTGWGEIDGAAAVSALTGALPPADRFEPNDDAGSQAVRLSVPGQAARVVRATLDFWDDPEDVYAVRLAAGERLFVSVSAPGASTALAVWDPATVTVGDFRRQDLRLRFVQGQASSKQLSWRAERDGWYPIELRITAPGGPVPYRLSLVRR
jgi:subtilisin family serine protease